MKKIILLTIVTSVTLNLNSQTTAFVGLEANPLNLFGGLEFTKKGKGKTSIFLRPTYITKKFRNEAVPVTYIDVPIGFKYLIYESGTNGSAAAYTLEFSAGPFVGYGISGKYPSGPLSTSKIIFGTDANAQFDPINYGLFLNTQMNIGGVFGFGVSRQIGFKELDMSRLGTVASNTKEKSKGQFQITVNIILNRKKAKK